MAPLQEYDEGNFVKFVDQFVGDENERSRIAQVQEILAMCYRDPEVISGQTIHDKLIAIKLSKHVCLSLDRMATVIDTVRKWNLLPQSNEDTAKIDFWRETYGISISVVAENGSRVITVTKLEGPGTQEPEKSITWKDMGKTNGQTISEESQCAILGLAFLPDKLRDDVMEKGFIVGYVDDTSWNTTILGAILPPVKGVEENMFFSFQSKAWFSGGPNHRKEELNILKNHCRTIAPIGVLGASEA